MGFELCTFAELKGILKLDKNTIQEYPALNVLKASVEAAIEAYLGRALESIERTETVYLGRFGTSMVSLNGLPVTAVKTVVATDAYGNQETLLEDSQFRVTPYGLRLFAQYKDIELAVTYTGGYAAGSVPGDISRAALLQTIYENEKSPHLGAETVQNEGGNITYPELGLLKHVKQLLAPHVHPLKVGATGG